MYYLIVLGNQVESEITNFNPYKAFNNSQTALSLDQNVCSCLSALLTPTKHKIPSSQCCVVLPGPTAGRGRNALDLSSGAPLATSMGLQAELLLGLVTCGESTWLPRAHLPDNVAGTARAVCPRYCRLGAI